MGINASITGILLVFYLVLLVKAGAIKRPFFFMIGALAVAVAFFFDTFFSSFVGQWARILTNIFVPIANVVAFAAAIANCYGTNFPKSPTAPPQA